MYVPYLEYQRFTHDPVVENVYNVSAPYADAFIDNMTLDRVGKAVRCGDELPDVVKMVYATIIDSMGDIRETGGRVSSFSNDVDTYTFDTSTPIGQNLMNFCAKILPVEWISANVDYEGGNVR